MSIVASAWIAMQFELLLGCRLAAGSLPFASFGMND
jgi:hypothetical protein